VAKRRFQRGYFVKEQNGGMYSMHYIDLEKPDGSLATKQVKRFLGNLNQMSERAARQLHAKMMEDVNRKRGCIAPVRKGQTFQDAVSNWRNAITPNLSPATVRANESFLRTHVVPRFGKDTLQDIGIGQIQQFATDLRQTLAGKTIVNVLGTMFAVLRYAEKCGMRLQKVGFADLELGSTTRETPVAFFTRAQANGIIATSAEPFKTLFSVAWFTGMRAGELLALTLNDLDFENRNVRVNKSADDNTREIRQPKTKASVAQLPMPSALEATLRNYLLHWKPNARGLLFATSDGMRPLSRERVVKVGLKPALRKLGIAPAGLHAFRHGLATELSESCVPITVLQAQMRHADIKTTLKVYAHAIPQSQRDAMENIGQSLRSINTLRFRQAK
jgi:integrase